MMFAMTMAQGGDDEEEDQCLELRSKPVEVKGVEEAIKQISSKDLEECKRLQEDQEDFYPDEAEPGCGEVWEYS